MQFKNLKRGEYSKINGSHLVGRVNVTYQDLIQSFGLPHGSDGYKSDAEWALEFEDGTIATIYNWKNGKNYLGTHGSSLNDIEEWHVGGFNQDSVDRVMDTIKTGVGSCANYA